MNEVEKFVEWEGDGLDAEVQPKSELEDGRVWRRGLLAPGTDGKKSSGPVLRTTVKPVKRFRPDFIVDKTNPSPSRKKRTKYIDRCSLPQAAEDGLLHGGEHQLASAISDNCGLISVPNEKMKDADIGTAKNLEERMVLPCQTDFTPPPAKKKRQWEQWSIVDKDYFFEAVSVHGKDFESITSAIAQKQRKKGGDDCVPRTKDQVRHLYYRTWAMISKLIDASAYPANINKAFQELYAVINFGEIRKKLGGSLKKKGIEKLNELIRYGSTSTRVKGKNFRIKTPSCKALKKMNPDYKTKEGDVDLPLVSDTRRMKIPLYVTLELLPLSVAAWSQVTSIAHNPRLRIRLPVECQLSSIFSYLGKKWSPLSSRLYQIASQCQDTKNSGVNFTAPQQTCSSVWERSFYIRTPPESSVNTRIMVFQVSNNKTHCIVSYALRKCAMRQEQPPVMCATKLSSKSKEGRPENGMESIAEEANGAMSEPDVADSCPSSEEDYDCDSAGEDILKDCGECDHVSSTPPDSVPNVLNKSLSLKEKLGCGSDEHPGGECHNISSTPPEPVPNVLNMSFSLKEKMGSSSAEHPGANTCLESLAPSPSGESLKPVVVSSKVITASLMENDTCSDSKALRVSDNSHLPETPAIENKSHKRREQETQKITDHCTVRQLSETDMTSARPPPDKGSLVTDCSSFSGTDPPNNHCKVVYPAAKSASIASGNPSPLPQAELQPIESPDGKVERKKDQKYLNGRKQDNHAPSNKMSLEGAGKRYQKGIKKSFTKNAQRWTAKSCRKITIAEIYIILGKPSVFRLCYDWIRLSPEETEECNILDPTIIEQKAAISDISCNSGLMALIRAARLSHQSGYDRNASTRVQNTKLQSAHKAKFKHAGIQCDIKKAEYQSPKQASPVHPPSNPHGRGVSKVIPVETVLMGTGFAVPDVPATSRQRKIARNNCDPMKTTLVSPETVGWLLRKDRSRSLWQSRKAMLGEQAARVKPSSRSMKTFSIVTRGPNKVGFLPVVSCPTKLGSSAVLPNIGTSVTSRSSAFAAPNSSSSSAHSLNIEKFLGIDTSDTSDKNASVESNKGNLLIRAAKEAGVAPSTPNKDDFLVNSNVNDTGTVNSVGSYDTEQFSEVDMDNEQTVTETQQNEDILCEAFGKQDSHTPSRSQIPSAVLTAHPTSASGASLSQSSSTPETLVDPVLEMSWSSNENSPTCSPTSGHGLMEKLVPVNDDDFLSTNSSTGPTKPPVDPWIATNSSFDGAGLCNLLNTPQKLISDDMEEAADGVNGDKAANLSSKISSPWNITAKPTSTDPKYKPVSQEQSSNFLAETEVDLQLQCMLNENSVDYIAKFQDLVRQTEGDFDIAMVADENAL